MTTRIRTIAGVFGAAGLVLFASACGGTATVQPLDPCETALGGPDWESSLPEAEPGLEALVAATDLSELPAQLDTSGLSALDLALLAYALDVPQSEIDTTLDTSLADDVHPRMRDAILASFAQTPDHHLDGALLRRAVHRYYACARSLPVTRDELVARYGDYHALPTRTIARSIPKQTERVLYEDPDAGFYVAETTSASGVESEVILDGARSDGALEFLAYDTHGRLVDRTPLAMTSQPEVLPVPFTCAMCHRTLVTNLFDTVDPGS